MQRLLKLMEKMQSLLFLFVLNHFEVPSHPTLVLKFGTARVFFLEMHNFSVTDWTRTLDSGSWSRALPSWHPNHGRVSRKQQTCVVWRCTEITCTVESVCQLAHSCYKKHGRFISALKMTGTWAMFPGASQWGQTVGGLQARRYVNRSNLTTN